MAQQRHQAVPKAPSPTPPLPSQSPISESNDVIPGTMNIVQEGNVRQRVHYGTAPNRTSPPGSFHSVQIEELRNGQADLLRRVNDVEKQVRETRTLALSTDEIIRGPFSASERSLKRLTLFLNIAAIGALKIFSLL